MAGRPKKIEEVDREVGVEEVKKTPTPPSKKEYRIENKTRRNQKVYGVTRKPVEFDDRGIAVVEPADYDHFGRVPGYKKL
jgi:hypothetical protein